MTVAAAAAAMTVVVVRAIRTRTVEQVEPEVGLMEVVVVEDHQKQEVAHSVVRFVLPKTEESVATEAVFEHLVLVYTI